MNKIVKLGDICDLQNGFAFKSSDYVEKSNTLNIRMSNIRPDGSFNEMHKVRYLPDSYSKKYKEFLLKDNDLIIAMTDMAGDPKILGLPTLVKNINSRKFLLNQRVGKLHKFSKEIYVPYLCYFLKTLKEYYKNKGAGGLQINISKNEILSASIILKPITEQKQIVAKLDAAFAEMNKNIHFIKNKEQDINVLNEIILSDEFKLGPENKKLNEVCKIFKGGTPDTKNKTYWNGNAQWLTPRDMGKLKNENVIVTLRQLTEAGLKNSSASLIPKNSIILSCRAPIGHLAINNVPMAFNQGCKGLVPDSTILHYKYLYYFLFSSKKLLNNLGTGTTFKEISSKVLSSVKINMRSLDKQKKIINKLDLIFKELQKLKDINKKQIENYSNLKKTLLNKELISKAT